MRWVDHTGLTVRESEDMGPADLYAYGQAVRMGHDVMNGVINEDDAMVTLSVWLGEHPEPTRVAILLGFHHGVIGRA